MNAVINAHTSKLRSLAVVFGVLVCGVGGCSSFQPTRGVGQLEQGLTLVLPGVEGRSFLSDNVAEALEDSHVRGAIEVHDWTTGRPWQSLEHLTNLERNQVEASRLAQRVIQYRLACPSAPINLVGHSGGGAIIAMAVSQLPAEYRVNKVVLLSPAISPQFHIQDSLARCDALWCFHSPYDFQLTVGTSILGTVDRDFLFAAGAVGFDQDLPGDNLFQIPFRLDMIRDGNLGGHLGTTQYRFVCRHVAPILLQN